MTSFTIQDLVGTWEIVEADAWVKVPLNLSAKTLLVIAIDRGDRGHGEVRMAAGNANLDVRFNMRGRRARFEFSWGLVDGTAPGTWGRGWGHLKDKRCIWGRLYVHQGEESGFIAIRSDASV